MASRSYFGKMNSTLGSVVPLAMFFVVDDDVFKVDLMAKKSVYDPFQV